ncbi:MAG: hypothetical protein IH614_16880 [Desulfuromonadales bacterium]|nr:hypothetical protein [Desulfuromonadales bacterium]
MKMFRKGLIVFAAVVLSLGLVACEKKGPLEKAGEKIDQGVENTKDAVQDATQGQGPVEKAGEKIDKAFDGK